MQHLITPGTAQTNTTTSSPTRRTFTRPDPTKTKAQPLFQSVHCLTEAVFFCMDCRHQPSPFQWIRKELTAPAPSLSHIPLFKIYGNEPSASFTSTFQVHSSLPIAVQNFHTSAIIIPKWLPTHLNSICKRSFRLRKSRAGKQNMRTSSEIQYSSWNFGHGIDLSRQNTSEHQWKGPQHPQHVKRRHVWHETPHQNSNRWSAVISSFWNGWSESKLYPIYQESRIEPHKSPDRKLSRKLRFHHRNGKHQLSDHTITFTR